MPRRLLSEPCNFTWGALQSPVEVSKVCTRLFEIGDLVLDPGGGGVVPRGDPVELAAARQRVRAQLLEQLRRDDRRAVRALDAVQAEDPLGRTLRAAIVPLRPLDAQIELGERGVPVVADPALRLQPAVPPVALVNVLEI